MMHRVMGRMVDLLVRFFDRVNPGSKVNLHWLECARYWRKFGLTAGDVVMLLLLRTVA
jgi:hypothetical protein